jgi:hypothetical protein
MLAVSLIANLTNRGIALRPLGDRLVVEPASKLTNEDRQLIRQHKLALMDLLIAQRAKIPRSERVLSEDKEDVTRPGAEALALLARLRGYSVPGGRMPVVRELALRLRNLDEPFAILNALRAFESQLIGLGGKCDDDLVETLALVKRSFPGAILVSFHRRLDS